MTTQTTQIKNKIAATGEAAAEDLALLKALTELADVPEAEPDDKVVHKGDDRNPAPIVRTKTRSAGMTQLRRNYDGKLVDINKNQLLERLKQKLEDGRPAWLPPKAEWKGRARVPDKLCLLNAEHSNRARMDELNLEVCTKRGKLMGAKGVRYHMLRKHKDSWDTIQRDEQEQRQAKRDERDARTAEALTVALMGKQAAPAVEHKGACPVCQQEFVAGSAMAVKAKIRWHRQKAHGKETANGQ